MPGDLVNFFLYVAEEVIHLPFFFLRGFLFHLPGAQFDLLFSFKFSTNYYVDHCEE